jgi:hypothetical protein
MFITETIMRRAGATRRPHNGNGQSVAEAPLGAAETGQARDARRTYNGHRNTPKERRRRKIAISSQEKAYICAVASFVIALLIMSQVISFPLHQGIGGPPESPKAGTFERTSAKAKEPLPSFETLFKNTIPANSMVMPKALGTDELEETVNSDFGGLSITIFEEEGAKRNMLHDYSLSETDFRFPEASTDDDVDA